MSNRLEEIMQSKCVEWFNNTHLQYHKCLFAVNNNSVNKLAGAIAKAKGVKSGVSDLILLCPKGLTLLLEAKVEGGTQSKEQKEFERQAKILGHIYIIFRSLDEFQAIVNKYFDAYL